MQKNENVSEKRLLLDFTIYQSNIVHSNYNLCPGYRFERLRDCARRVRPRARNHAIFQNDIWDISYIFSKFPQGQNSVDQMFLLDCVGNHKRSLTRRNSEDSSSHKNVNE